MQFLSHNIRFHYWLRSGSDGQHGSGDSSCVRECRKHAWMRTVWRPEVLRAADDWRYQNRYLVSHWQGLRLTENLSSVGSLGVAAMGGYPPSPAPLATTSSLIGNSPGMYSLSTGTRSAYQNLLRTKLGLHMLLLLLHPHRSRLVWFCTSVQSSDKTWNKSYCTSH